MNVWQLTGVLKENPTIEADPSERIPVMTFTLKNDDKKKAWEERRITWVICVWKNPPHEIVNRFREGVLVYVRGAGFLGKRETDGPDKETWRTNTLALEVEEGTVVSGPLPLVWSKPRRGAEQPPEDAESEP